MVKKTNILFLCTENRARSQMAEAITRKLAGNYFEVYSAGFKPSEIYPLTYTAMEEWGVSLDEHRSKSLDEYLGKIDFEVVITVCSNADKACPTIPGIATRLHWPITDPGAAEGSQKNKLDAFRNARDELVQKIKDFLNKREIPYVE